MTRVKYINPKQMTVTAYDLRALWGISSYDEDNGLGWRYEWHLWPPSGKEGHIGSTACWCKPMLLWSGFEDGENWQHRNWQ